MPNPIKPSRQYRISVKHIAALVLPCALAALGAVAPIAAGATESDWTGSSDHDWNNVANWTPGVPTDIAGFGNSGRTTITFSASASLNTLLFKSGAPAYKLQLKGYGLTLNGAGIDNESSNTLTIITAPAGSTSHHFLHFRNKATAGNARITLNGESRVEFADSANADTAQITANESSSIVFIDTSNAKHAKIAVNDSSALAFANSSTAGSAQITTKGATKNTGVAFIDSATAGNAQITTNGGSAAEFLGSATADHAQITANDSSLIAFDDSATAGDAQITANESSRIVFISASNAERAKIVASDSSALAFANSSTAGNAQITSNGSSIIVFGDSATAGDAQITTNGGTTDTGVGFTGSSSAGNARITVNNGSVAGFYDNSTAGNAQITINDGSVFDMSPHTGSLNMGALNGTGDFYLGANHLIVGGLNTNATISGVIHDGGDKGGTGGGLTKIGSGTLVLNGTNTYTGDTTVQAGSLIVGADSAHADAAIIGPVTVDHGATLGGHGSVGSLTASGTITPGNSIGTLTVAGDYVSNHGSVYQVETDAAGHSDRIEATGTAKLNGGQVEVLAADGDYAPATDYTILSADGGVTGQFETVNSNLIFLDPSLAYGADTVTLTLTRNDIDFTTAADTYNQRATAAGAEALGVGNAVYNSIATLDAASARAAFDALSGEAYASTQSALLGDSRYLRSAVSDRLLQGCVGAPRPTGSGLDRRRRTCAGAVWMRAFGAWGHQDGDGNAARLDHDTRGVFIGADTLVADAWRLGFIGGYSRATSDVHERASSGSSDSYQLGLYTGTRWGQLNFHAGAAYAWHEIESRRRIDFPGFTDATKANYTAHTAQVFTELGYDLNFGRSALTPFARAAYVHLDTDSFDESGGAAALHDSGKSNAIGVSTLGVRLSSVLHTTDTATIRAHGLVGWRHAYGDVTPEAELAFDGGNRFTVSGVPLARDALALEAGLDADVTPSLSLGATYVGQFGDGTEINGVKGYLAWAF